MDYYEKLRKATDDSEPSTLFDELSMMDELLNSLAVKIAITIHGFRKRQVKGHAHGTRRIKKLFDQS